MAISSPLLEASVDGAHGVLLSIQGGSDLGLFEINEAARLVQEAAHPEANIIFGAVIDDALGDEVRVTVIAAGFDGGAPVRRRDDGPWARSRAAPRPGAPPGPDPRNGSGGLTYSPSAPVQCRAGRSPPHRRPRHRAAAPRRRPGVRARLRLDRGRDGRWGPCRSMAAPTRPPSSCRRRRYSVPVPAGSVTTAAEAPRYVEMPPDRSSRPEPRPLALDDDLDVPDFLK